MIVGHLVTPAPARAGSQGDDGQPHCRSLEGGNEGHWTMSKLPDMPAGKWPGTRHPKPMLVAEPNVNTSSFVCPE